MHRLEITDLDCQDDSIVSLLNLRACYVCEVENPFKVKYFQFWDVVSLIVSYELRYFKRK